MSHLIFSRNKLQFDWILGSGDATRPYLNRNLLKAKQKG